MDRVFADCAESYYKQPRTGNFLRAHSAPPQVLLSPMLSLLVCCRLRQSLSERTHESDGMLRHYGPVNLSRAGQAHFAGNKLRKHKLMDRRRGGMNPTQLLRCPELIHAKLPAHQDFGIPDLVH